MTTRGKGKSEKGRNPGRNVIVEKTNKRALRDSEGLEREGENNSGFPLEHQFPGLIHSLSIAFGVTWTAIMFREYLEYDTVLVRGLSRCFTSLVILEHKLGGRWREEEEKKSMMEECDKESKLRLNYGGNTVNPPTVAGHCTTLQTKRIATKPVISCTKSTLPPHCTVLYRYLQLAATK